MAHEVLYLVPFIDQTSYADSQCICLDLPCQVRPIAAEIYSISMKFPFQLVMHQSLLEYG